MSKLPKGMVKKGHRYYLRIREVKEGRKTERTIALGNDLPLARVQYMRLRRRQEDWRGQPTVEEFSKRWITDYVTPMRPGKKGPRLAEQRLRDYVLPVIGSMVVGQVTEADFMTVRARLEKTELAPLTVRHILSDGGCLFRFAVAAGLIARSPFTSRVLPRIQEEIPEPLSDDELDKAIENCPPQHLPLLRLALWTGQRYSELRGLMWSQVELEGEEPHLLIVRSGHAAVTKSRRPRRIPLGAEAVLLLRWLPHRSDWVFTGRFGGMVGPDPSAVSNPIKAKLPAFHFHRLRHTFACRCLQAGMSLAVLQRLLGHSTIRMTERYARLFDPEVTRGFRAMAEGWMPMNHSGEERGKERGSRAG
jgi:integrase